MLSKPRLHTSKLWRQTKGTATVEFALVAGLLFLLVMGILDFGHAWFMRQAIINASREGARYAVVYRVDAEWQSPCRPSNFAPSVKQFTENLLSRDVTVRDSICLPPHREMDTPPGPPDRK